MSNKEILEDIKDRCRDTLEEIFDLAHSSPEKSEEYVIRELEKDLEEIKKESKTICDVEEYTQKRIEERLIEEKYDTDNDNPIGIGDEVKQEIDELDDELFFTKFSYYRSV